MGDKRKRRIADRYREDGQYSTLEQPTKKEVRTESKTSRLEAKANLALAKAQKRKYLAILLGLGLLTYVLVSTGSITKGLDLIKGIMP